MQLEVEIKLRLTDPERVEQRAAELGPLIAEICKDDLYFRPKTSNSRVPRDRYRLRQDGTQNTVTFKQKRRIDGIKFDDEVEFNVDNVAAFFRFADRFGFEPFVAKRKRSRVYRVGQANVEINHIDHLGYFSEIEILCQDEAEVPAAHAEIKRVMDLLGLTDDDREETRYIELIQDAYPVSYQLVDGQIVETPLEPSDDAS